MLRVHGGKIRIAQWSNNKVDESKSIRLLGLCVVLRENARSRMCNQKMKWSNVKFEDVSHLRRIARVGWRVDWLRVEDFPRSHSIRSSPRNSGRSAGKARHTWQLQWSNNLHVHVQRHCSGKERKWRFLCYDVKEDQRVRLKIQRWTLDILGTRGRKQVVSRIYPVFQGMSPLGRGIPKQKNNRDTIHFNGEYCIIDLLYRDCSFRESALYLRSSHTVVWKMSKKTNSGDTRQSRHESTRKTHRNSNQAGESQVIGWYPETTASFGKPNAPELERFQFDVICEQNWTSPNNGEILPFSRERKSLHYYYSWRWRMVKTHVNVQRIHSAQKPGGFKAIRIDWCKPRNWSSLKHGDCFSYWCSRYWSASTIAECPRMLRMDLDKSWSRKICERNSSSQL